MISLSSVMTHCAESSASESFSSDEETGYSPGKLRPMVIPETDSRNDVLRNTSFLRKVRIYPEAMDNYLKKSGNVPFKKLMQIPLVKTGSFVFVAKSLAITMNIENPRIRLPKSVLLDACVFTYNNPVLVLTIADASMSDRIHCEKYNTFIARGLTETLRREDSTVCVINGVLDQSSDIQHKLNHFHKRPIMFKQSVSMNRARCESLIRCLLASIAICKTFRFWDDGIDKQVNFMMNREEFMCLMKALDGTTELCEKDGCSAVFIVDYICRLSRGHTILLDVHRGLVPEYTLNNLNHYVPLLEINLVGRKEKGTNYEYIVTVRRTSKGINWKLTSSQTSLLTKTPPTTWTDRIFSDIQEKVPTLAPVMFQFVFLLVMFIFREEKPASIVFALSKCNPIMYLIYQVYKFWRQTSYNRECWWLLVGLTLSCIGDAVLVWKHIYLLFGIMTFAAAYLSYAKAFGLQFDNLKALGVVCSITTPVVTHFGWNLDKITFCVLVVYTASITTMGWRVLAKVSSLKSLWQSSTYLSILSAVCFLVCNIVLGYEIFRKPFFGSHVLSMATYYVAQLGITLSVLSGILTKVQMKHAENMTVILFVLSSLFLCGVSYRFRKLIASYIVT